MPPQEEGKDSCTSLIRPIWAAREGVRKVRRSDWGWWSRWAGRAHRQLHLLGPPPLGICTEFRTHTSRLGAPEHRQPPPPQQIKREGQAAVTDSHRALPASRCAHPLARRRGRRSSCQAGWRWRRPPPPPGPVQASRGRRVSMRARSGQPCIGVCDGCRLVAPSASVRPCDSWGGAGAPVLRAGPPSFASILLGGSSTSWQGTAGSGWSAESAARRILQHPSQGLTGHEVSPLPSLCTPPAQVLPA